MRGMIPSATSTPDLQQVLLLGVLPQQPNLMQFECNLSFYSPKKMSWAVQNKSSLYTERFAVHTKGHSPARLLAKTRKAQQSRQHSLTSTSRSTTSVGIFSMRISMTLRISPLARARVVVWMFCWDCVLAARAVCLCTCGQRGQGGRGRHRARVRPEGLHRAERSASLGDLGIVSPSPLSPSAEPLTVTLSGVRKLGLICFTSF